MYCPQCATPNAGDVKFCRSCGTGLESVALALSGKPVQTVKADTKKSEPKTAQDWLEKRIEGVAGITRGSILLLVSLLIGVAIGVFMPSNFDAPWILVWMVFFGWMAVWGGIEMANGIGNVLESKGRLRLMGLTVKEVDASPQQSLPGGERPKIASPVATFRASSPVSVTEGTTRQLDDYVEK